MSSATRILELASRRDQPGLRQGALQFFGDVVVRDEPTVLSFVAFSERLLQASPEDEGLRLSVLKAFLCQLSAGPAIALAPRVIEALESETDAIRLALLEDICERSEDLWLPSPDLRERLAGAIAKCGQHLSPQIAAAGWLAMLLFPGRVSTPDLRKLLWKSVAEANEDTLACWLEKLENYNLPVIFDEVEDVEGLKVLIGRFCGRFDRDILGMLCEIGSDRALRYVSQFDYEPDSWRKTLLLRQLAELTLWDHELDGLLERSSQGSGDGLKQVWVLLARFNASQINVAEVVERFPDLKKNSAEDRKRVVRVMAKLKASADVDRRKSLGKRLAAMVKKLDT